MLYDKLLLRYGLCVKAAHQYIQFYSVLAFNL